MRWIYLLLGLWVAASPWLVGVFGLNPTMASLVAGSVIAILALWSIFGLRK
jgi:hypothetical protein